MMVVNKFCCLLGVVIFYCNSVFAVQVSIIGEDDAPESEYQKAYANINEVVEEVRAVASKKDKDNATLLKVCFGVDQVKKFSSGTKKFSDSKCPGDFFSKRPSLEQQEAHLLFKHHFPLEKFNFTPILACAAMALARNTNELTEKLCTLELKVEQLQTDREIGGISLEDLSQYVSVLNDATSYIRCMHGEGMPLLCERIIRNSGFSGKTQPSDDPGSSEFKIWETYRNRIPMHKKEAEILPKVFSLLPPPRESFFTEDEGELRLRLYCYYWGNHAEDALIYFMLQGIRSGDIGTEPILTIEIYGNRDPCFQCQIKLQWLVNRLAELSGERDRPIISISYYSNSNFQGPCLYAGPPHDDCWVNGIFTTRTGAEENKIKKFIFKSEEVRPVLEIFQIDGGSSSCT